MRRLVNIIMVRWKIDRPNYQKITLCDKMVAENVKGGGYEQYKTF